MTANTPPVVTAHYQPPRPRIPRKTAVYVLGGVAGTLGLIAAFCSSGSQEAAGGQRVSDAGAVQDAPPLDSAREAEIAAYEERLRDLTTASPLDTPATQVVASERTASQYRQETTAPVVAETAPQEPARIAVASRRLNRYVRVGSEASGVEAAAGSPEALGATNPESAGPGTTEPPIVIPGAAQPAGRPITGVRKEQAGTHRVLEGTVIDGILMNRLDGASASPVRVLVTTPVYSSDYIPVIPKGATVLGRTSAVEDFGVERLAVAFHRLILPNGTSVDLDGFRGLNQAGDSGLRDQVNTHWWSTFGASAAVGLIGGLTNALGTGFGDNHGTTVILGSSVDGSSQAAARVMDRFLNRPPTITIREGHRIKIYIASDLDLPAYLEARR